MDCSVDQKGTTLKSKKFIAYLVTLPLIFLGMAAQTYVNYKLALLDKDALFSEGFMELQLYIIGALAVVYVGGQAALDAVLGWARGNGSKQPQVVVVGKDHLTPTEQPTDRD